MRRLLLCGERGLLYLCMAIPQRIYGMRTKLVAFIKHCLTKLWLMQQKPCKGGKKAKICITLAFFVNAAGEKEMPIVIGKSASPRCFKGTRDIKMPLGVPYHSNAKAWMDSVTMLDILNKIN